MSLDIWGGDTSKTKKKKKKKKEDSLGILQPLTQILYHTILTTNYKHRYTRQRSKHQKCIRDIPQNPRNIIQIKNNGERRWSTLIVLLLGRYWRGGDDHDVDVEYEDGVMRKRRSRVKYVKGGLNPLEVVV